VALVEILKQIDESARRANRNTSRVQLLGVSKKQPLEKMKAYQAQCQELNYPCIFGENYVQEFKAKREEFPDLAPTHLIGPLQSNKVKLAVSLFACIQSVHSLKVLELIAEEAEKQNKVQSIFLQVDISCDQAKSGFLPEQLEAPLSFIANNTNCIKLAGLMTITRLYDIAEQARPDFAKLREIRDSINPQLDLSMGMSADYSIAVEEGATIVRVGSALFGERLAT